MGNTIWIEVDGRPVAETHNDMNVLLRLEGPLDALAEKLGVSKLSGFFDWSVMDAAAEAELLSISDGGGQKVAEVPHEAATATNASWFDSTAGLSAIKALSRRLAESWDDLAWTPESSQRHWPKSLITDLRYCETVLEDAVVNGQRFRLVIVP